MQNIEILYEDEALVFALKPHGVISESCADGKGFCDLLALQCGVALHAVHRLDREVGGVMVFAKSASVAAALSEIITAGDMEKEYLTVVSGCPVPKQARLTDLLYHDRAKNKTYVVKRPRRGVREASLSYEVLSSRSDSALLHVWLHTGRTHQIRVQFASRRHPVAGDRRYGSVLEQKPMALFSHRISFVHPITRRIMSVVAYPSQEGIWQIYQDYITEKENENGRI